MSICNGVYPSRRNTILVAAALISTILFTTAGLYIYTSFSPNPLPCSVRILHNDGHEYGLPHFKKMISASMEEIASTPHRKLLLSSKDVDDPTRIEGDIKVCSESDLVVSQGPSDPLPSGIPTYTVEIVNMCATGCNITSIHMRCGWFSSARVINPSLFKRVDYDDCVVNEGRSLLNGETISFQYANTYSYPLSVSAMICS